MSDELLTMALQAAPVCVLAPLAAWGCVWAICYWADVMRGR